MEKFLVGRATWSQSDSALAHDRIIAALVPHSTPLTLVNGKKDSSSSGHALCLSVKQRKHHLLLH